MTESNPPEIPSNLPGEPAFPTGLPGRLQTALDAKGSAYEPRTHHLQPGGAPVFTNRLVLEGSPYLLQHAHNPVNWYPWGDEAFADARRLGRPVFLSIGYSTCHWCHVMEGESFEDEEIAAVLNQNYIPVKVDREERPDVDAIYMSAVQALTGQGGWPMSVWLTPDRAPFFAGTYFPPRDGTRGARFGFLTLLKEIRRTYDQDTDRVKQATDSLTEAVKQQMEGAAAAAGAGDGFTPSAAPIQQAVEIYTRIFDPEHGGLRRAPKFPSNIPVRLLLRHHQRTGDAQVLHLATFTLQKMAAGGMYDQIGGGFHRYSTDERWLVPHFEKMLYDNALLAVAYAEAWQLTRRPDFARVLRETLDYVLREMTSPEGAFYSATDADSEGEEGKFFVWSASEVREILGQLPGTDAEAFMRHHDITPGGNFEGHNIPNVPSPSVDDVAHAQFAEARKKLYDVRAKRVPPLRDDKILAAWNGLMISGFAVAGRVLGEPRYVDAAARAADFLLTRMRPDDRIRRAWKDGPGGGQLSSQGFLEDQAFVIQGLLDLFESRSDAPDGARWLREALALADAQERHFADVERGGWFMTANDAEVLIAREKPAYDGAEPSGTSVALMNAQRLHTFTTDDRWRQVADRGFASVAGVLDRQPLGLTEGLLALDYRLDVPREIAVVHPPGVSAETLAEVARTTFVPSKALVVAPEGSELASLIPWLEGKPAAAGQPTAYVCEHGTCELPTGDPETLRHQLARARPYSD
jgi:uncharacterized protein YyaL (SSP411 family)